MSVSRQITLIASDDDRRIAALAAAAVGLTLVEAAIPLPLPGVKPGLANIIGLVVLCRFGWSSAVWVTLLRVVAGALLLGTFLTPTFVLSLGGATLSLLGMGLLYRLYPRWLGPVGLSVLAAFAHMAAQLAIVNFWLMPAVSLLGVAPLFLTVAWITGLVNGLAAAWLLQALAAREMTT